MEYFYYCDRCNAKTLVTPKNKKCKKCKKTRFNSASRIYTPEQIDKLIISNAPDKKPVSEIEEKAPVSAEMTALPAVTDQDIPDITADPAAGPDAPEQRWLLELYYYKHDKECSMKDYTICTGESVFGRIAIEEYDLLTADERLTDHKLRAVSRNAVILTEDNTTLKIRKHEDASCPVTVNGNTLAPGTAVELTVNDEIMLGYDINDPDRSSEMHCCVKAIVRRQPDHDQLYEIISTFMTQQLITDSDNPGMIKSLETILNISHNPVSKSDSFSKKITEAVNSSGDSNELLRSLIKESGGEPDHVLAAVSDEEDINRLLYSALIVKVLDELDNAAISPDYSLCIIPVVQLYEKYIIKILAPALGCVLENDRSVLQDSDRLNLGDVITRLMHGDVQKKIADTLLTTHCNYTRSQLIVFAGTADELRRIRNTYSHNYPVTNRENMLGIIGQFFCSESLRDKGFDECIFTDITEISDALRSR